MEKDRGQNPKWGSQEFSLYISILLFKPIVIFLLGNICRSLYYVPSTLLNVRNAAMNAINKISPYVLFHKSHWEFSQIKILAISIFLCLECSEVNTLSYLPDTLLLETQVSDHMLLFLKNLLWFFYLYIVVFTIEF